MSISKRGHYGEWTGHCLHLAALRIITKTEFYVLVYLSGWSAGCWKSAANIAKELELSEWQVWKYFKRLKRKGILFITKEQGHKVRRIRWPKNVARPEEEFHGNAVPTAVWKMANPKLGSISMMQLLLLCEIDARSNPHGEDCRATNKELAALLHTTEHTIKARLHGLRMKGLLETYFANGHSGRKRYLRFALSRKNRTNYKKNNLTKTQSDGNQNAKFSTDLVTKTQSDGNQNAKYNSDSKSDNSNSDAVFCKTASHNGSSSMPFFDEPSIEDFDLKIARQLMKFSKEQRWSTAKELKEKSQSKIIAQLRRNLVRSKLRNKNKDSITLDLKVDLNTVAQEEIKQVVDFVCSDKRHLIKKNFRIPSAQSLINSWDSWELLEHAKKNKPVEISSEAKSIFKRLINYHVWNQFEEQELLTAVQLSLDRYSKLISILKRRKDEFSKRMIVMLLSYFSIERWWQDWSDWLNKLKDKGESFNGKVSSLVFSIKSERFKKFSSDDPTRFDHKQWYSLLKEISHEED